MTWQTQLVLFVLLCWFTFMVWKKQITMTSFHTFLDSINTRGGNIIILLCLSGLFFNKAIAMFYWVVGMMIDKKLTPDNAVVLAGWAFVTGTAFGGAFATMINTMTGSNTTKPNAETKQPEPKPDVPVVAATPATPPDTQ